jgi:hypothetical protein
MIMMQSNAIGHDPCTKRYPLKNSLSFFALKDKPPPQTFERDRKKVANYSIGKCASFAFIALGHFILNTSWY